jgi:hypothetical protein
MHSNFWSVSHPKRMFSSIPLDLIFFSRHFISRIVRRDSFFLPPFRLSFSSHHALQISPALCLSIQCACFICSVQLLSDEKNYVSQSMSSFSFYLPFLTILGLRLHVLLVGLAAVAKETPLRTSSID